MPYKDIETKRRKQREYNRRHYELNKQQRITEVAQRKRDLVAKMREYKAQRGCPCGETHPACLDFHHTDDNKDRRVADMAREGVSWEKILIEIQKCEVLCANCHRKLHYNAAVG